MNVLIVHAQPKPTPFNAAMTGLAVETLTALRHRVQVSDLCAMGRSAVAGPADIAGEQARLARADRVFARDFAYLPGRKDAATRARHPVSSRCRLQALGQTPPLFSHPAEDNGPDERLKPGVVARSGVRRNV